jgi:Flp pilus assembly protein TadG
MVTAETAVVIPFGIMMVVALLWVISLGLTQVRLVDAAREGARLVARGDSVSVARQSAQRSAPTGTSLDINQSNGTVVVDARVRMTGLLPMLPELGLHARSVAASERS